MKHVLLMLTLLTLAAPVVAAEPEIRFTFPEWQSILHQEGLRQEEAKLLRQQNGTLKQLQVMSEKQYADCKKLNADYEELSTRADELQRATDRENAELRQGITWRNWAIGGQIAVIAGLVIWAVLL